jgi:hypothetical protein
MGPSHAAHDAVADGKVLDLCACANNLASGLGAHRFDGAWLVQTPPFKNSPRLRPAARTRTSSWREPGSGTGVSRSSSVVSEPCDSSGVLSQ